MSGISNSVSTEWRLRIVIVLFLVVAWVGFAITSNLGVSASIGGAGIVVGSYLLYRLVRAIEQLTDTVERVNER